MVRKNGECEKPVAEKDLGKISSSLWNFQNVPDGNNGNKTILRRSTRRHIATHSPRREESPHGIQVRKLRDSTNTIYFGKQRFEGEGELQGKMGFCQSKQQMWIKNICGKLRGYAQSHGHSHASGR